MDDAHVPHSSYGKHAFQLESTESKKFNSWVRWVKAAAQRNIDTRKNIGGQKKKDVTDMNRFRHQPENWESLVVVQRVGESAPLSHEKEHK